MTGVMGKLARHAGIITSLFASMTTALATRTYEQTGRESPIAKLTMLPPEQRWFYTRILYQGQLCKKVLALLQPRIDTVHSQSQVEM